MADGWTDLHRAAHAGDVDAASRLLTPGHENELALTAQRDTPLHLAAHASHPLVVELLLGARRDPALLDARNAGGFTALMLSLLSDASAEHRLGCVQRLLSAGGPGHPAPPPNLPSISRRPAS